MRARAKKEVPSHKQAPIVHSKRLYRTERKFQLRMGLLSNLAGMIALVLLITFGNAFYNGEAQYYTREQVVETMSKVSATMSSAFSGKLGTWYDELSVVGQFLSMQQVGGDTSTPETDPYMQLTQVDVGMFSEVGVLTESGSLILTSGKTYPLSQNASVRFFLQNRPAHSYLQPQVQELANSMVFIIPYEPEQIDQTRPIAGIVGTVRKETVSKLLETDAFGSNYAYVVLSDEKGNVIVDTGSKRKFGNNLFDTFENFAGADVVDPLRVDLQNGASNIIELMGKTERFLMYYTPIEQLDELPTYAANDAVSSWRLLILTSTDALNKSIVGFAYKSKILLYSTLTVMTALLLLMSILFGWRNRKLLTIRSTDSLTGLLNSKRFKADANLLIRSGGEKYAVLSVNIARFKMINSNLGHHRADEILCAVGSAINAFLRPDEITARTHSDHFAVLLNTQADPDTDRVQEFARYLANETYPHNSELSFTLGVYRLKADEHEITLPLDYARYAQRSLKKEYAHGFDIVYYDDEAYERHKKELNLTAMAPKALANNEFVVYYQLKRSVGADGDWVGCEALVRWENSRFGFLFPGIFIELFEKNGFIAQVDLFVFETVCRDLRRSLDEGKRVVPVSVNVSNVHFDRKDFLKEYESIMDTYQIPRELIEFEITETLAVSNTERVQETIEQIHRMGCRCALDDFGTGYSSFDMIINFNLDTIKLDSSLFRGTPAKVHSRREIIQTLIALTHRLGMQVVAEGIETQEQAAFLEQNHCDAIQGFLYAKPAPYEECRALLDKPKQ